MSQQNTFDDVLDVAEQLDADAQAELVAVLSRRLAERGVGARCSDRGASPAGIRGGEVPTRKRVRNRARGTIVKRTLLRSSAFGRDLRKWLKSHPDQAESIEASLEQLSADATHPSLRTHKLRGALDGCWACSAGYDLRPSP